MNDESKLLSDEMQDQINRVVLHGHSLAAISKDRPEVLETQRIQMAVFLMLKALISDRDTIHGFLTAARKELDGHKDESLTALFDREQAARAGILDFFDCATESDVDILPLFNFTGYHWHKSGDTLTYSSTDEALIEADDEYFDKSWSAHGYTLVRAFWQSADGDVLMIFENKLEVP
jgi:hypothetical protein